MPVPSQPHVFAATQVLEVSRIDSKDTVAVRLRGADGGETAILLPLGVANDLLAQLARIGLTNGLYRPAPSPC